MATLKIGDKSVTVDDTFLTLSPEQQSATVDEIAGSIGARPSPGAAETAKDAYKSFDAGVARAAAGVGGFVGDAMNLGAAGLEKATNFVSDKLGIERYQPGDRSKSVLNAIPTSESVQKAIQDQYYGGAKPYEPQTTAGKYARTGGEFIAGALGGPAGIGRRILTQVAAPAVASEAAGQMTEGSAAEPYARVAAALAAPTAVAGAARAVTPFPMSAERQRLVDVLQGEGVTSLTAGQRTGNKGLQYFESALGDTLGSGQNTTRIQGEGQRQFTEAAMRRAGDGPAATPEVLHRNAQRLGQQFEDLSARNTLQFDPQFNADITAAVQGYMHVPPSQQRAIVQNYVQDIVQHMQQGQMPGAFYQEMRSRLSRQSHNLRNADPTLSEALGDIRNALDNAMGRSIAPADQALWNETRRQWGAQRTIENTASRAGEAVAEGNVTPSNLRNAVAARNRGQYARGQGDFSELARAGSAVMAPLPNSGTGQRVAAHTIASLLGGAAGSIGGAGVGSAIGAAAGAMAGPAIAGRALMSAPTQSYLGNQLVRGIDPADRRRAALVNALIAAEQQRQQLIGRD